MSDVNTNPQREFALDVVRRLHAAGHRALWAGGCVRDQLMSRAPQDYDVATSARPEEVTELFGRRRTIAVGASFGVISVLGRRGSRPIEVATFRQDEGYQDGRHPDRVSYTDAEHDAQRRDFTINGLFYDPLADEVIDYVDGQRDLEAGIVRAIGNPRHRFTEDKLRLLRAVRFAAQLDFELEAETQAAATEMAAQIVAVSAERIGAEIRRMLLDDRRSVAISLLRTCQLLPHVLPEALVESSETAGPTWSDLLEILDHLRGPSVGLALAALVHHAGSAEAARIAGRRLRFTNKEIRRAAWLVDQLPQARRADELAWSQLQPLLVDSGAAELVQLIAAILGEDHAAVRICQRKLTLPASQLNPAPLIDGQDLIDLGITPGREIAVLLQSVRDAQLEGQLRDKPAALRYVAERRGQSS